MIDVPALTREAGRLLQAGRLDEAADAYRRSVAEAPAQPDAWFNLGYLHRYARRFEEALAAYGEAVRHGARAPQEAHVNRAAILSEHLGRYADAEAELRTALAANPGFLPAWLNLGNLHEDLGQVAEARKAYEGALRAAPGNGRALARLTAIDVFAGHGRERVPALEEALRRRGLDKDEAAELGFALGTALDSVGDYSAAFRAFEFANRMVRERLGTARRYDPRAHEQLIDALIAVPPGPPLPQNGDGAPPIFICGMFRSGSTLAEHLLGRHSRITAGGEIDMIPAMVGQYLQPYPQALASASGEMLAGMRAAYLDHLRSLHPAADLITDKRPDNFLHIGLIKAMFPSAKIVHSVREPLDNILSIFFLYFDDSITYGWSLDSIAHWYGQYRRLMSHWRSLYGADMFDLPYDALVSEPREVIAGLLDFLDLPREDLLSAAPPSEAVRTPSAWQVRKPLHGRSSGRWRHYATHLEQVRAALERG